MGIFDFLKNAGREINNDRADAEILENILTALSGQAATGQIQGLQVHFDDGIATISGTVNSMATKQKAILIAGNIKGVEKVNDDNLVIAVPQPPKVEMEEMPRAEIPTIEEVPKFSFYTIQRGDSLSKIAKRYYGDAMRWPDLFEANREVIQNPDLIYPGQQIRVPIEG